MRRISAFASLGCLVWLGVLGLTLTVTGCKDRKVEQGLESDANGFFCNQCSAKFYTDRRIFASYCPQCKQAAIEPVIGFSCPADKHVTLGPRSRGARRCEKCGQATSGMVIPAEADFKAWGAAHR